MHLDSKMRCPRQSALDARNDWLNDEKRVALLRETGKRSERQQEKLTGDAKKMKNSIQKIVQRTHGRDTIVDSEYMDTIIFGAGIAASGA